MLQHVEECVATLKKPHIAEVLSTVSRFKIQYLEGCVGPGVSFRGLPPARASDRKRTSKSSCSRPFSEGLLLRLLELCNTSLHGIAHSLKWKSTYVNIDFGQCKASISLTKAMLHL
jgi:hypothetical protein